MVPLRAVKFIQMESRKVVAGGWGRGSGKGCLVGMLFQFTKRESSVDRVHSYMITLNVTQLYT